MDEYPHGQVRAVTHHEVTAADIDSSRSRSEAREALAETRRRCAARG